MAKKYFYIIRTNDWNPKRKRFQDGNFIVKISREGFTKELDGRLSYGKPGYLNYIDDWHSNIKQARKELRRMRQK